MRVIELRHCKIEMLSSTGTLLVAPHDQVVLLAIIKIPQNRIDYAEYERRRKMVAKFMYDANKKDLEKTNLDDVVFLEKVELDESEWSEIGRLFISFQGWAKVNDDDELSSLKHRIFEAEQLAVK